MPVNYFFASGLAFLPVGAGLLTGLTAGLATGLPGFFESAILSNP
jgi:hypothetical protein